MQPVERVITIGALQLDPWRQMATLGDRTLPLTPTEFRVLLCMAERAGAMLCVCGKRCDNDDMPQHLRSYLVHQRPIGKGCEKRSYDRV